MRNNTPESSLRPHRVTRRALLASAATLFCSPAKPQVTDLFRIDGGAFAGHVEYHPIALAPGKEIVLADLKGPAKITYFYFTDDSFLHPAEGSGSMYPGLVLKVMWDDAAGPSIQVPLWTFFGVFHRKTIDYQSAVMQINHHCYISYLPMPFARRALLVLANDGDQPYSRSVAYGIDYDRNDTYKDEPSRLHAVWNRSNPTRNALHRLLDANGKGQYVGNFLQLDTRYEGWWGEGDTLFRVDGELFTHSPGTEDEYGSAWEFEHTFSSLYSGYIQMEQGRNRMYRWYVANPVRFRTSLTVDIQDQRNQHGQVPSQDDITSVAYWYQDRVQPLPALPLYRERIAPSQAATYPR